MGAKVSKQSNKQEGKAILTTSQGSSIIKAIKPECQRKRKAKKNKNKKEVMKRAAILQYSPEIDQKRTRVRKLTTLEDWLLASPSPGHANGEGLNGGELYVFKHFSRRVHPSSSSSSSSREPHEEASRPAWDSFSGSGDIVRSRCGKPKKKVSFRLPEEAEIVIFYSPPQTYGTTHQQSF